MHFSARPRWGSLAAAVAAALLVAAMSFVLPASPASAGTSNGFTAKSSGVSAKGTLGNGYWFVATDGGIFTFGENEFFGSTGNISLNQPIVGMAPTPTGEGYWMVAADGGIFTFGDAKFYGSTGAIKLNKPIVGMAPTPSGLGYYLVATDGGIFTFGDAVFRGSTGNIRLNQPIVGMEVHPSGLGYWMVAADGGIFTFGEAKFFGSTGAMKLNKPIVGMTATPTGTGYWFVASDGGIFTFGDAKFFGSTGAMKLNQPIVGMDRTASGQGYWFVASDGGIFSFGDAKFFGSTGHIRLNRPVVGMAAAPYSPVEAPDFVFTLSGAREVTGTASGTGDPDGDGIVFMDFTDDELCYTIEVDNITLPPTAAHIHEAPEGVPGPVFQTLKTPNNQGFAEECIAMDKAKIAEILAHPQRFYVNIHTSDYPDGAVRGQLADELMVAFTADNKLFAFFTSEPGDLVIDPIPITGLGTGEVIVGGDLRPRTLDGYVVTKDASNVGRVYKISDPGTGTSLTATRVGTTNFTLTGTSFGVDFDPVDDNLRIVSDADMNGRFDLTTGTFTAETPLNPPDPAVTGIAYSNNVAGSTAPTSTTLYDFDTNTGFLFTQNETTGTLTPVGDTGLTVDPAEHSGLDIGIGPKDEAAPMFLVTRLTGNDFFTLYAVNPATGTVTRMGDIGDKTITNIVGASLDVS
jgi:ribosomal protein L24E